MEIINPTYAKDPITKQITGINATVDGVDCLIPICPGNRHYDFIIENNIVITPAETEAVASVPDFVPANQLED